MRRYGLVVIVAILCTIAVQWWRGRTPQSPGAGLTPRHSVVLITIDTLRADRLGRGLTPSLDALAARGLRFANARAAAPLTLPSHVTIMTGTLPPAHGVRDNGIVFRPGPPTLAGVFHGAGYRTGAFVGAYVLNHVFGLAAGFDVYDDRVRRDPNLGAQLEAERRGSEVVDAALGWIGTSPGRPFFLWVHLYDPHAPYDPPAEFQAKAALNGYDGEVAYADAQVGRLVSTLAERGLITSADTIVVTGDHGEGLGDHGEQAHGMLAYDSTLRVPLIVVSGASRHGETIAANVSLAGVAGTVTTLAGIEPPAGMSAGWRLDGGRGEAYAETEYPRGAGWHVLTTLAADRWKLILSSEVELYDVAADPGETTNVAQQNERVAAGMTARARELAAAKTPRQASSVSTEAAERLRALGYVGGAITPAEGAGEAPNPARHVAEWTRFELALSDVNAGRAATAVPALKALAARFPDGRVFQATCARALKDAGSARAAVDIYKRAVARWPDDASLYHDLSVAARAAGDPAEALRAEQASLALEGSNAPALNGLGLLQADSGNAAAAAASFERATSADPSNASYWVNLGNARRETGDLDNAEIAYRKALDLDSDYPDAANGLGVVLVQRKRSADAIALFERAVKGDPTLYEAQLNLGIAYQESGDPRRAADAYRRLLATAPPTASRERQAAEHLLRAIQK